MHEKKVWQIRVDLNVLNYDGNILDCANVALICAMAHFRLPEVSVIGDEIKIVNIFFVIPHSNIEGVFLIWK